jgi:hypothetical protein
MTLWNLLGVIFLAGGVGGVANALLTENGFILPRWTDAAGIRALRPGFLLNAFVGGLAGAVSWGLYGPFASYYILGGGVGPGTPASSPGITLAGLVGAVLVGVAGARWLTNEAEKKVLRARALRTPAPGPGRLDLGSAAPLDSVRLLP